MKAIPHPIRQTSHFGEPSINSWHVGERYFVAAFKDGNAVRLDILRNDLTDGLTWDELQGIKNACGFENQDAVEFYPAQSDVLSCANMRHLYVFDEKLPLVRRRT